MYLGGRKDLDDPEYKTLLTSQKDGTPAPPQRPSDVRNGDLVSLLLAATPPYLYNMPLVPQTFFFSEMLRSFVQAKAERQNQLKTHQIHRRRKRTWRESTPPKPCPEADKPLELTTPRAPEKAVAPVAKKPAPSVDFTAEKLANSSVTASETPSDIGPLPTPPMWYPNGYPNQPPYPIDPLHFFIDLRVSAHIWDRKLNGDRQVTGNDKETTPLNLSEHRQTSDKVDLNKGRQNSAFSVPEKQEMSSTDETFPQSKQSVHYVMSNLKKIYSKEKEEDVDEDTKKKKKKDLRALIGLELVVDYVKQESDGSEDEKENEDDGKEEETTFKEKCAE